MYIYISMKIYKSYSYNQKVFSLSLSLSLSHSHTFFSNGSHSRSHFLFSYNLVALGKSSRLHMITAKSGWTWYFDGLTAVVCPCVVVHMKTLFMNLPSLSALHVFRAINGFFAWWDAGNHTNFWVGSFRNSLYIYWQHFFIDTYLIQHCRHFLSSYILLILWSCHIDLTIYDGNRLINSSDNKKKLQILEAVHNRNKQPKFNTNNFESSANVLKYL